LTLTEEATVLFLGAISEIGCGWVLRTNGQISGRDFYLEVALPKDYEEIDLRVEITYFPNDEAFDCVFQGASYFIIRGNLMFRTQKSKKIIKCKNANNCYQIN